MILCKFELWVLKILYNMASPKINLTLKVTGRMILPLAKRLLLSYWVLIIMKNNLSVC